MIATPMKIIPPYTPELLKEVQLRILKERRGYVLEYGSGWSTIWWSQMGFDVVSIETDRRWYVELQSTIESLKDQLRPDSIHLRHHIGPVEISQVFDLVYVDGEDIYRPRQIERAVSTVKPNGVMIVDDCHWDSLRPSIERVLATGIFEREWTIGGMHVRKTGERKYHETTLLRRLK